MILFGFSLRSDIIFSGSWWVLNPKKVIPRTSSQDNSGYSQDILWIFAGYSQVTVRNTQGSCSGLFEILPGLLQDLNEETWKEWTHRVSISRPSVYEPNSLPRWTVPYDLRYVKNSFSICYTEKLRSWRSRRSVWRWEHVLTSRVTCEENN